MRKVPASAGTMRGVPSDQDDDSYRPPAHYCQPISAYDRLDPSQPRMNTASSSGTGINKYDFLLARPSCRSRLQGIIPRCNRRVASHDDKTVRHWLILLAHWRLQNCLISRESRPALSTEKVNCTFPRPLTGLGQQHRRLSPHHACVLPSVTAA